MAKSIKILHVIHSLKGGGAERQLCILASEQSRNGYEVGIFCINNEQYDIEETSTIKIITGKKRSKYSLIRFAEIANVITEFSPDIIHVWLPASITIPSMLVAFIKRKPVIFSYRNRMFFHRLLSIPEYLLAFTISSGIVSNNNIQQSHSAYRMLYNYKNGTVIKNAVKIDLKYRKELNATKNTVKTILYVGRLTQQKNWECIIRALKVIRNKFEWQLIVCGDGEDSSKLQALVNDMGFDSQVHLLGYQNNVYDYMKSADVLILPSWFEGMPNVLIEAFWIGLPCIISNIPAHKEIVSNSNCALMFPPDSPNQLAECLQQIFCEHGLSQRLVKAAWRVADELSPSKLMHKYDDYYRAVLAEKSR